MAVDVEGWQALGLATTLEGMQTAHASGTVNLVLLFDACVMGIGHDWEIELVLTKAYQRLVYRSQGWISAVVLEEGVIQGLWKYDTRRAETEVTVNPFKPVTAAIRQGNAADAVRLAQFWGRSVRVTCADI